MASEDSTGGGAGELANAQKIKGARRYRNGVIASFVWIVAAGLLAWLRQADLWAMELNEWGDFFAGVFAPLAFLWLVLGYLQQGEELRMQAAELNASVKQQRALVEVARNEFQARKSAALPHFRVNPDGHLTVGQARHYRFKLLNYGATVSRVRVRMYDARSQLIGDAEIPLFTGQGQLEFSLEVPRTDDNRSISLEIGYLDAMGHEGHAAFSGGFDPGDRLSAVQFESV